MIVSWVAVVALTISYWCQIYKIHVHKEVRDLSLSFYWLSFFGFGVLGFQAYYDNSFIFMVKQIATTIPIGVILMQIYYHKRDHWYDATYSKCFGCKQIIEPDWKFCPGCGLKDTGFDNQIK